MKIGFVSLGCSKNLVDSEHLLALFEDERFQIENNPRLCDVIFINTCGFILSAKQEAIDTILEMAEYKKENLKKLIVTGCFVQRYKEELIEEFPEVDAFIRIDDYPRIREILSEVLDTDMMGCDFNKRLLLTPSYFAYLKIAEGCNHRCAYCAIPNIRGNYVSEDMESILEDAKKLAEKGVKELNVIAQDTAYYGREKYGRFMLSELLKKLDEMSFTWIRVLYLYPDEMNEELLQTIADSKHILPYFDMPVQYGSDRILKAMRRPTTVEYLKDKFNLIHSIFKGKEILRTTFMVGFPSEKDVDFEETLLFIQEERFDSLGAFMFSPEEGTVAAQMDEQVDENVKQERFARLMETQKEIVDAKNREKLNRVYDVLVEKNEGLFTRSYGRAYFSAPEGVDSSIIIENAGNLPLGEFVKVRITGYKDYDLIGVVEE